MNGRYTQHSHISIGVDRIIILELRHGQGFTYRILTAEVDHTSNYVYGCIYCVERAAKASYKRFAGHKGKLPEWSAN